MTVEAAYPYSPWAFEERVRERFERRADLISATSGDDMLNPGQIPYHDEQTYRDAAVLMAVFDRGGEATVLLTQRTEHLSSHKGQIAFPGGKIDSGETPIDAALREAEEEVGLSRSHVRVLGAFGDYFSGSGYRVSPVVGMVDGDPSLTINTSEVHDAFEVPLAFLMDASKHEIESLYWKGKERKFFVMPYQETREDAVHERRIWGLTAGIIRTIQQRLYG